MMAKVVSLRQSMAKMSILSLPLTLNTTVLKEDTFSELGIELEISLDGVIILPLDTFWLQSNQILHLCLQLFPLLLQLSR